SSDLAKRALPRFVWITPDLCHDMHSCPIGDGDRFLAGLVPTLQRAVGARGAIVITWDEGADHAGCCLHAAGGQIPTIVAGPGPAPPRAPPRQPGGRGPVPVRAPVRPLRLLSGSPALESRRFTPPLRARSAILVDASTGRVLWALHPHRRRPIASTTKIMTG